MVALEPQVALERRPREPGLRLLEKQIGDGRGREERRPLLKRWQSDIGKALSAILASSHESLSVCFAGGGSVCIEGHARA